MSVSLPGAKVVNIHLMQQQEQLFLISLLGMAVSIFFLVKGWRQRGSELVQGAENIAEHGKESFRKSFEHGKESFRKSFVTRRMLVIILAGAVVLVLGSGFARYLRLQQAHAAFAECMTYPHGDTEEAKKAHKDQCMRASYLR